MIIDQKQAQFDCANLPLSIEDKYGTKYIKI